jgi:hypothetical protein
MQKSGLSLTDIIGFEGFFMLNSVTNVILVQLFSNQVSISPTFNDQLLQEKIPKALKYTTDN